MSPLSRHAGEVIIGCQVIHIRGLDDAGVGLQSIAKYDIILLKNSALEKEKIVKKKIRACYS